MAANRNPSDDGTLGLDAVKANRGVPRVMISGAHAIIYSKDADADRAFLRDVLGLKGVDAGQGWLIYALPPSEVAVHPAEANDEHELYFMCDDVQAEMKALKAKKVKTEPVMDLPWGILTSIHLPGGGKVGLYQPKHPLAHGKAGKKTKVTSR